MILTINGEPVHVPTDLSEITLSKFLQYYDGHGRALDQLLKEILEKKWDDEFDKDLALFDYENKEAIAWYSFHTGFDFTDLPDVDAAPLMAHYRIIRALLHGSEQDAYELPASIEWDGQQWEIKHWKVKPGSHSFNELVTAKEMVRALRGLQKGKWDTMPYLCAMFFRKKEEQFKDEMIDGEGERMKLMYDLPMDIVVKVAFFLTISVNFYSSSLASRAAGKVIRQ